MSTPESIDKNESSEPPSADTDSVCSECDLDNPFHCLACHGVGFVETPCIKCSRCEGNPRGCYQCTGGYIQHTWTECDQCFLFDN